MPVRAGVILRSGDQVLIVQTKSILNPYTQLVTPAVWGFPKGRMAPEDMSDDAIDSLIACGIRELFEETGLQLTIRKTHKRIRLGTTKLFICWLKEPCSISYTNVKDKNEISDIRWISIAELRSGVHNMNHSLREFLTKKESFVKEKPPNEEFVELIHAPIID